MPQSFAHAAASTSFLNRRIFPGIDWVAENAFIPPGAHRLLTAGGLAIGLWAGRALMDVVSARKNGEETDREEVFELLRPLHGLMRYNPYSDKPADRWKFVIDRSAPMITGAIGAWLGSRHYAYGKDLKGNPFFKAGAATKQKYDTGHMSLQTADSNARRMQADAVRVPASIGFVGGSATGTQLLGALFPLNNGGMSGLSFQMLAERMINLPGLGWLNRGLFGNTSSGSRSIRPAMADATNWAFQNLSKFGDPSHWLTPSALQARAQDALLGYEGANGELEKTVANNIEKVIRNGYDYLNELKSQGIAESGIQDLLFKKLAGTGIAPDKTKTAEMFGFLDHAFDNMIHGSGANLANYRIGQSGKLSFLARVLGSVKAERVLEGKWAKHLADHYGVQYGASRLALNPTQVAATWGSAAAAVGTALTVGGIAANQLNSKLSRTEAQQINAAEGVHTPNTRTQQITADADAKRAADKKSANPILHWFNDKPLDVAQWVSRVLLTPPSMHRFMSAAYLSTALWLGMQVANALTGRKLVDLRAGPQKSLLTRKETFLPFRPLHGLMAYDPGSIAMADRWKQAAHFLMPVAVGALGTFTGSHMFFRDRIKKLENPKTIEDFTDRINVEQSKVFAGLTAITSIFNTGSGVHMLPFFNYSSNLHNRYLLASGQQVAMPGLGKWWSGNPGLAPWGVARTLQYITKYLAHNPDARPTEMASLVHSVVAKLYPDMPEVEMLAKKQAFIDNIHEVRDSYLVDHKVPMAKQPELQAAMQKLLSGEGLENLLLESGLNPAEANLASNGASGAISNVLGSRGGVNKLQSQYRQEFATRLVNSKSTSRQYLGTLADRADKALGGSADAAPHDQQPSRFAERAKREVLTAVQSGGLRA